MDKETKVIILRRFCGFLVDTELERALLARQYEGEEDEYLIEFKYSDIEDIAA